MYLCFFWLRRTTQWPFSQDLKTNNMCVEKKGLKWFILEDKLRKKGRILLPTKYT